MKKALCFLLGFSLVFCLPACQKETPAPEKPVSEEKLPDAVTENDPAKEQAVRPGLFWEMGIAPVEYEIDWTVEGTAETCVQKLTHPFPLLRIPFTKVRQIINPVKKDSIDWLK